MRTLNKLLACAMALVVPLCTRAQTEIEPNNGSGTATPVGYNTAMAGSTGACSPTDNSVDYFSFTSPAQGNMRIQTAMSNTGGTNLNVTFRVRQSSTAVIATYVATAGANNVATNNTFLFPCQGTGGYFISIENPSGTVCTNYSFTYDIIAPVFGNDLEPNDNSGSAIVAAAGVNYDGQLDFRYGNTLDYFRLQAPNDGVLNVTIQAEHAGASTTDSLDLQLQSNTTFSLVVWRVGIGANGVPNTQTLQRTCTGTEQVYYLIPRDPDICGVSYRFSYSVTAPVFADDLEPNQTSGQAISIDLNAAPADGRVEFEYDNNIDFFGINHLGGPIVLKTQAEAAGTAGTMQIRIRAASSALLETAIVPVGGGSVPVSNTYTSASYAAGTYYLEVFNPTSCGASYRFDCYDSDTDGTCNAFDLCPGGPEPGTACNDNNVCTTGDVIGANCLCAGTFQDADGDGTCDANDLCPGGPEPGTACNDNNVCTTGDVIGANCLCAGTFQDADGDGTCDANDLCPGGPEPGTACNDNNVCTTGDVIGANCLCAGTFQDADGDGTCDANDLCPGGPEPGTACNDNNVCTTGDVIGANCLCAGTFQDADGDGTCDANDLCPGGPEPGTACNDGNALTINDVITPACVCAGTPVSCVVNGDCNDSNPCTSDACVSNVCVYTPITTDTDGDGTPDCADNCPTVVGQIGSSCSDGNACTINDVLDAGCLCAGTLDNTDTDGDGVPNCSDNCPTVVGQIGSTCNDGNALTINDVLNAICVCQGTPVSCVVDGDCNDSNPCTSDACVGNACVFTPITTDTDGDGTPDCADNCPTVVGQIGSSCSDGNACTINDVLDAGCVCAGTLDNTDTDGDGVPNCSDNCPTVVGQIGSTCDDGNALTVNDVLNAVCVCAGTPVACVVNGDCNDSNPCTSDACVSNACVFTPLPDGDGDGICDAQDNCPALFGQQGDACNDGNAGTIGDVITAACVCAGTPIGGCQPTQLTNTADPIVTCGITGVMLNGTTTLWSYEVPGANKYQFNFVNVPGQPSYTRNIAASGRSLQLFKWATLPLKAGRTYRVRVRASFNGGSTWCAYSVTCNITVSTNPGSVIGGWQGDGTWDLDDAPVLHLHPNPSREETVFLKVEGLTPEAKSVSIEVYDAYGRRVHAEQFMLEGNVLNTTLRCDGISAGLYLVNVSIGDQVFTQRMVRQ